jgi:alkylhydroperoxidase family enzyme
LAFLEKVTLFPNQLGPEDLAIPRRAGVSDQAILDATYVCVGFNIIARIADALGFKIPSEDLFVRAAKLLRVFGYRRLSGFWTSGSNKPAGTFATSWTTFDPHAKKMLRLRYAVLSGPGSLPPHVRQAISEGARLSGALGAFVQKIAADASALTDDDIAELHRAHYTDDQIFEAIVSAALGAGLFRLERVLGLLRDTSLENLDRNPRRQLDSIVIPIGG